MSTFRRLLCVIFCLAWLWPAAATAEPFQVNQYTTGDQRVAGVAPIRDHGFVVVWTSVGQDGYGAGTYARWFDGNAVPLGDEVRVNVTTDFDQDAQGVATDAQGRAVVVWTSADQDGNDLGVFARLFDPDGVPAGGEIQVNTTTTGRQHHASVAMAATGEFVVVWEGPFSGGDPAVFARQFGSDGLPLGGEIVVEVLSGSTIQESTSVATTSGLAFVAAWDSWVNDQRVYARLFDAGGVAMGPSFQVSSDPAPPDAYIDGLGQVASDAGSGFVVGWRRPENLLSDAHHACRYAPNGTLQWCQQIASGTDEHGPAVTMTASGGFVTSWCNVFGYYLSARRFHSDGTPATDEMLLMTNPSYGVMSEPRLARLGTDPDRWVVVWTDQPPSMTPEVLGMMSPDWVFGDGVELGGTASWSLVVPRG